MKIMIDVPHQSFLKFKDYKLLFYLIIKVFLIPIFFIPTRISKDGIEDSEKFRFFTAKIKSFLKECFGNVNKIACCRSLENCLSISRKGQNKGTFVLERPKYQHFVPRETFP